MPEQQAVSRSPFRCEVTFGGRSGAWVNVGGDLDATVAPDFDDALDRALTRAHLVVVDMHQVTLIDRAGARRVVQAVAYASLAGSRMVVLRPSGAGQATLDLLCNTGQIESYQLSAADPGRPS